MRSKKFRTRFLRTFLNKRQNSHWEDKQNGRASPQRKTSYLAHSNGLLQFKYARCSKEPSNVFSHHDAGDQLAMWPRLCALTQHSRKEKKERLSLTATITTTHLIKKTLDEVWCTGSKEWHQGQRHIWEGQGMQTPSSLGNTVQKRAQKWWAKN